MRCFELQRIRLHGTAGQLGEHRRLAEPACAVSRRSVPRERQISHLVSIRTSQNGTLAFTRDKTETVWLGLSDADFVLVSCVDDFKQPCRAILHLYIAPRLKGIYSREYANKKKVGVKLKPETGFFIPLNQLPAITHPEYFGVAGILARPEDTADLAKYIQLGPASLRSFIEQFKTVDRSLSEWETLLARSLGVGRKAVSITIPKHGDQSLERSSGRNENSTSNAGGQSRPLLANLSPNELSNILYRAAVDFIERSGYQVDRDPLARGRNTRRVTKTMGGVTESSLFSIRTSQIGKIGYKRDR